MIRRLVLVLSSFVVIFCLRYVCSWVWCGMIRRVWHRLVKVGLILLVSTMLVRVSVDVLAT